MTHTFLVGVQVTGAELPTQDEVKAILADGRAPVAFTGPGRRSSSQAADVARGGVDSGRDSAAGGVGFWVRPPTGRGVDG
jgi:hypothetical protein